MQVYIGYDEREPEAYRVAAGTLKLTSGLEAQPLDVKALRQRGLYTRTTYPLGENRRADAISQAPMSTDFAISRFLVPILCQTGLAVFTDSDVVFLEDLHDIVTEDVWLYPVSVVRHNRYEPRTATKMDGQLQTSYHRKNWSSVMVFNCAHPANRRLSLHDINMRAGIDLHSFYWLTGSEIGELDSRWNWLVGEQPKPLNPAVAHFTLGGPWLPDWSGAEYDDVWKAAERRVAAAGINPTYMGR